jgi:hypothetical protein
VPDQEAIDGGTAGETNDALPIKLMAKSAGSPAQMRLPQFEQPRLDFRGHLMRGSRRSPGVISQTGQAQTGIAPEPAMDGLPGQSVSESHIADRGSGQHFGHGLVPLFHQPQLHEHGVCPPQVAGFLLLSGVGPEGEVREECHRGTGATVAEVPELHISTGTVQEAVKPL